MTHENNHLLPKGINFFGFGFVSLCTHVFITFGNICSDLKQNEVNERTPRSFGEL